MGHQDQNGLVDAEDSNRYWLAIGTTSVRHANVGDSTYWCLPMDTRAGDVVYMYIPRAQSSSRHGIVALAHVTTPPTGRASNEYICKPYSLNGTRLHYTPLTLHEVYKHPLTPNKMKDDRVLATSAFVRRNFQATIFPLSAQHADRIAALLAKLNTE